jgi:hypothetical protein
LVISGGHEIENGVRAIAFARTHCL